MAIARRITAQQLRILCYHGFSYLDEHDFSDVLFMAPDTFDSRMNYLKTHRYPVVTLDDAIAMREAGTLPPCTTVLTFDDGWQGFADFAMPILLSCDFAATVYVTTYYVNHQEPVFNVFAKYCFSATERRNLSLHEISDQLQGDVGLETHAEKEKAAAIVIRYYRSVASEQRKELWDRLRRALSVNTPVESGAFRLMQPNTLTSMKMTGFDLQLHTHRHRFYDCDDSDAAKEIADNRNALSQIGIDHCKHFCFPSGAYHGHQLAVLRDASIVSATTTRQALVTTNDSALELPRILDRQQMSLLEFEAEMSGFADLLRRVRSWLIH